MRLKSSILAIYAIVFLLSCIVFTVYNYEQLSEGEGWGLVGVVYIFGLGILLLLASIALHNLVKNKTASNIIGLVIAVITTLIFIYSGFFN